VTQAFREVARSMISTFSVLQLDTGVLTSELWMETAPFCTECYYAYSSKIPWYYTNVLD